MQSYQQLGFEVNDKELKGRYVPKVQVSMIKEIFVSNTSYSCSEEIAKCEIVEKELRHSDREKFLCIHLNIKTRLSVMRWLVLAA